LYAHNVIVEGERELSHVYATGDSSTLLATLETLQARASRTDLIISCQRPIWRSGEGSRRFLRHWADADRDRAKPAVGAGTRFVREL